MEVASGTASSERPRATVAYAVVHMSPIDWAFRKQDQQFFATEFGARGHPVLFVENTGARFPALVDLARVGDRLRNFVRGRTPVSAPVPSGVTVVSPLCIPGASFAVERRLNQLLLRRQLGPHMGGPGRRPTILWIGLPTWAAVDAAQWLKPTLTVYYCGDALTELPGLRRGIVASERAIIQAADVVFAASAKLVAHCRDLGADALPVAMSVDFEASREAREGSLAIPPELEGIRGRLIGYMGGLNSKVDVALLDAVASRFSDDTVVVLGSVEDPRWKPAAAPNLVILGERPYDRISAYLVRFDVCLIPYRMTGFTEAVNPAKLLEYLAVGRPVVSTPLPEVLPFSRFVRIAGDHDSFLAAIDDALRGDGPASREERVRCAREHAFPRVAAEVIDVVEARLAGLGS